MECNSSFNILIVLGIDNQANKKLKYGIKAMIWTNMCSHEGRSTSRNLGQGSFHGERENSSQQRPEG